MKEKRPQREQLNLQIKCSLKIQINLDQLKTIVHQIRMKKLVSIIPDFVFLVQSIWTIIGELGLNKRNKIIYLPFEKKIDIQEGEIVI